jgi:cyanate permease
LGYAFMALLGAAVFWLLYRPTGEADDALAGEDNPRAAVSHTAASHTAASHAASSHTGASRTDASRANASHADASGAAVHRSAFRSPALWLLALVVGLGGFGQFTITYFVPSVADSVYGVDAAAAGLIISTGYVAAIALNLVVGILADRFDKLVVLGCIFVLLAGASASLTVENELVFRAAAAVGIGFGFSAANQLYGLAGALMPRSEAGNAMGIVSLGAGLFGYFGPQMLGLLRDLTGSFAAGFAMIAGADLTTLGLVVVLYRMTRGSK